ncbi:mechanosensitive ion channel family protein [Noviherbaspirillum sp.]|uniref:mechanosensitive ion channel family protein n=1 Tax=Noviherbaspirillum sp. TaxID=1926288 RepID=UPI002DDD4679|nr:mechanosensitive ion channel domain-containing protein [Noviherbaspirillum sp.]
MQDHHDRFGLRALFRFLLLISLWTCFAGTAFAQVPPLVAPPMAKPAAPAAPAAPAPESVAERIPIADIAVQAEAAMLQIRQLDNKGPVDDLIETAGNDLQALARGVSLRSSEMRRLLPQNASIDIIRDLQQEWRDIENRAAAITRELTRSVLQIDRNLAELEKTATQWEATRTAAVSEAAPPTVIERIDDVSSALAKTRKRLLERRTEVLSLQSRSAELGSRASQARDVLNAASERAAARLLYRDSPPLWTTDFWESSIDSFSAEGKANLTSQTAALTTYASAYSRNFFSHFMVFLGIVAMLYLTRRRMRTLANADECLRRTQTIFEVPVMTAIILALLLSSWFYPRPPRTFWVVLSVLGTVPMLIFARRLIESHLHTMLYGLVGFYLADKLRAFVAPLPVLSRVLFLVEALLFVVFLVWMLRRSGKRAGTPWAQIAGWRKIRLVAWVELVIITAAIAASINGQVRLADLIGGTALASAYTAVVLYVLLRVAEGLLQGLFCVPPVSLLGMVERHKPLLTRRINGWLRKAAYIGWIALILQSLGVLGPLFEYARSAWDASIEIGTFKPSVGDVLTFILIIWVTLSLSRFSRFVLDEEVYPKLQLERGLPYAVSTMVHYLVLLAGFVLALNALGVDMTKFTILAGAFSVGIGFGLQNIVNNFVSGLIVLFERPVKVGDTIQMDDVVGRVKRIGIRASVISSTTGAEVIIPNGKLISDRVTNWTVSSKLRQVTVPVLTKTDVDPGQVKTLLQDIARANELVAERPAPEALFVRRAVDVFEFELRVWIAALDQWLQVKSDLMTEIDAALRPPPPAPQPAEGHPDTSG